MKLEIIEDKFTPGQTVRMTQDIDVMFAKGTTARVIAVTTTETLITLAAGEHTVTARPGQIEEAPYGSI